jgi:WD40 repeat protein
MSDEQNASKAPIKNLDHHEKKRRLGATALAFSSNGEKLYGGFTDGAIQVWDIVSRRD